MSIATEDAPNRGDAVEFRAKDGRQLRGTVRSAYATRAGQDRVTIATADGRKHTRIASAVQVLTRAPAGTMAATASGPGQRPGTAAPNAGRDFPAEILTPAEVAAIIGGCSTRARSGIRNRAMLTLLSRCTRSDPRQARLSCGTMTRKSGDRGQPGAAQPSTAAESGHKKDSTEAYSEPTLLRHVNFSIPARAGMHDCQVKGFNYK